MPKAMTRRTKPKAEPIAPRVVEPETTLGEEPKCAPIVREREICSETCIFDAYRNGFCFHHHKLNEGFVLDEKLNKYVKEKQRGNGKAK